MKHIQIRYFWLALLITACSKNNNSDQFIELSGLTMGTVYNVVYSDPDKLIDESVIAQKITHRLHEIESRFSTYIIDSEISRINTSTTIDWINISKEFLYLVMLSMQAFDMTAGGYDITTGNPVDLWGFGPEPRQALPSTEDIKQAKSTMGMQHVSIRHSPPSLKINIPDIRLDMSGIVKGYASTEIAKLLVESGVDDFMVEIGGEITAKGRNDQAIPWRIGIELPESPERNAIDIVVLDSMSMATSGSYRNYFDSKNIRYSHIIDPNTAKPIDHRLVSVTVIHKSAALADAIVTGFMALGLEKALSIAEKNGIAAYFIISSRGTYRTHKSTYFNEYLVH
jgi:thiamine biosynthesis lipoprotein